MNTKKKKKTKSQSPAPQPLGQLALERLLVERLEQREDSPESQLHLTNLVNEKTLVAIHFDRQSPKKKGALLKILKAKSEN